MRYFEWVESSIRKFKWYHVSLLKLSVLFFTLFLITAWQDFRVLVLGIAWYWHLLIAVVATLPLFGLMFSRK
jgi:hypothetical protein